METSAIVWWIAVGWALGALWRRRAAVLNAVMELLDEPPPPRPLPRNRPSVRVLRAAGFYDYEREGEG